jgi:hypothetical protein
MVKFEIDLLQPGDTLLYFSHSLIDWCIALKTWTKVAHVEIYAGNKTSYASRNGIGVNQFSFRPDGLAAVLRDRDIGDWESGVAFFKKCQGQKYDWKGLLCFTLAVHQGALDKQFCSEFWTRFKRAEQLEPFNKEWDADRVPPSFCLVTPTQTIIWKHDSLTI